MFTFLHFKAEKIELLSFSPPYKLSSELTCVNFSLTCLINLNINYKFVISYGFCDIKYIWENFLVFCHMMKFQVVLDSQIILFTSIKVSIVSGKTISFESYWHFSGDWDKILAVQPFWFFFNMFSAIVSSQSICIFLCA